MSKVSSSPGQLARHSPLCFSGKQSNSHSQVSEEVQYKSAEAFAKSRPIRHSRELLTYSSTISVNALILHCFCNVRVPVLPYTLDLHHSQNLWYPFHVEAPDQNTTALQRGTCRTTFLRHCCVDCRDAGSFAVFRARLLSNRANELPPRSVSEGG
jgi:hypothetical protein